MELLPPADEAPDLVPNARWSLQLRANRYRGGLPDGVVHITLDDREELTLTIAGERARLSYGHSDVIPCSRSMRARRACSHSCARHSTARRTTSHPT